MSEHSRRSRGDSCSRLSHSNSNESGSFSKNLAAIVSPGQNLSTQPGLSNTLTLLLQQQQQQQQAIQRQKENSDTLQQQNVIIQEQNNAILRSLQQILANISTSTTATSVPSVNMVKSTDEISMTSHTTATTNSTNPKPTSDNAPPLTPHPPVPTSTQIPGTPTGTLTGTPTPATNFQPDSNNEIVQFMENQGTFLTPEGRYKFTLYDSYLRLRDFQYNYKIEYNDISSLFLLPRPDDFNMAFVIVLDTPIQQGPQNHHILVLETNKETQEIQINLDSNTLQKEYGGLLQPIMRGPLCDLVAKSFKVITRKKIFVKGKFLNAYHRSSCVECTLCDNEGHLYILEKSFVFIHEPPVLIKFSDIELVELQRDANMESFDLCVVLADQVAPNNNITFYGIDICEYKGIYDFLIGKKVVCKFPFPTSA